MPTLSCYRDRLPAYFVYPVLFTAILAIPSAAFAQGSGSSLSGLITDNSQAVVPAAVVKARHLSTNVSSQTSSDTAGYYRFPSLPVGEAAMAVLA